MFDDYVIGLRRGRDELLIMVVMVLVVVVVVAVMTGGYVG